MLLCPILHDIMQASRTVRAVNAAYIEVARVRGHVIQPAIETDHGTGRETGPFQCVLNTAASSTEPRLVATGGWTAVPRSHVSVHVAREGFMLRGKGLTHVSPEGHGW